MKQIKFRGFRTDGKGWVEGYYWQDAANSTVIRYKETYGETDGSFTLLDVNVHPESLSMFTGLTDKNSKEIFTKDRALYKGIEGVIQFEQQAAAFWFKWDEKSESGRVFHKYKELTTSFSDGEIYQCDYIEIIGNQYEPQDK